MVRRPSRAEIGTFGERIAASFIQNRGYRVEQRNVYSNGGEIDIVAHDGHHRVVFEVKTTADGVDPTEALDSRKLDALERAVGALPVPVDRIDVIAVRLMAEGAEVRWLRGVS
jgi:putative endonuclease